MYICIPVNSAPAKNESWKSKPFGLTNSDLSQISFLCLVLHSKSNFTESFKKRNKVESRTS